MRANDLIPILPLLGTRESEGVSRLKALGGEMKSQPGGAYNRVFNFGSLQTQGGGVQSF